MLVIPQITLSTDNDSQNDRRRPIIPVSFKLPDGTWSGPMYMNFDTGASYPTDIPPAIAKKWGSLTNSDQKYFDGVVRVQGFGTVEFPIPICLQDKAHYDKLISESPENAPSIRRYPLLRVRDLMPNLSFIISTENTIMRRKGTVMPEIAKAGFKQFPDMKLRTDTVTEVVNGKTVQTHTPTSGWQWLKVKIKNPATGKEGPERWGNLNTGERQCVIVDVYAKEVNLSYPSLGSDGRADTKCSFTYLETKPSPTLIDNKTMQIRSKDEDFARGGMYRNLMGGSPIKDNYKIVLWCDSTPGLHWGLCPR